MSQAILTATASAATPGRALRTMTTALAVAAAATLLGCATGSAQVDTGKGTLAQPLVAAAADATPRAQADTSAEAETDLGPTFDQDWPAVEGHPDLLATAVQPSAVGAGSWRGILRINCDLSHSAYDDPVVLPGEEGAAHLHRFYGN